MGRATAAAQGAPAALRPLAGMAAPADAGREAPPTPPQPVAHRPSSAGIIGKGGGHDRDSPRPTEPPPAEPATGAAASAGLRPGACPVRQVTHRHLRLSSSRSSVACAEGGMNASSSVLNATDQAMHPAWKTAPHDPAQTMESSASDEHGRWHTRHAVVLPPPRDRPAPRRADAHCCRERIRLSTTPSTSPRSSPCTCPAMYPCPMRRRTEPSDSRATTPTASASCSQDSGGSSVASAPEPAAHAS